MYVCNHINAFIVTSNNNAYCLQIKPNGIITFTPPSFSESTSTTTPKPLPIQDLDFIAPYWFDGGLLNICNESLSVNTTASPNVSTYDNETSSANETTASSSASPSFNETLAVNETSFFNETSEDSINDTSCRNTSTVYYRRSFSSFLQERATREIRTNFFDARNFFARRLLIITWNITDPIEQSSNPMVITSMIMQ